MDTAAEERFETFAWDDRYDTGVEVVDGQHHKLVDLINQLGAISARQASSAELGDILTELTNYTVYHFSAEEQLMRQYGVDTAHQDIHMKAHQHFTAQVLLATRILMGGTEVSSQLIVPLQKYLTNWLVQHILGLDKRLTQEILALQEGASHDDAVRRATAFMSQASNVLMEALNEMYGKLGDKTLEILQKNQELQAEQNALHALNEQLEARVRQRTAALEQANRQLTANNTELKQLNEKLESAQTQLLQSEKMASIGQLAAGVAHEINNPVGFVNSNLGTLAKYIDSMFKVIDAYAAAEVADNGKCFAGIEQVKQAVDFPYLVEDIPSLLKESQDGLARVKRIVQDLKDFSHVDEANWQHANLEQGMDSTLNVVANEIKYKAEVVKEYAGLPDVECMPSQLNQVFMNLLVNAAQAIDKKGTITVRTGVSGDEVWVEVQDTGKGIPPEHINRIFDPFFTTKPIGQGTGLGLSLSYGIVQKHRGRIEVKSEPGKGTVFRINLPVRQTVKQEA
ncbi:bacteriohemerythrin [Sideroxyarcus emersonii]|uniref:histidine kinase n=1 Tax=Sideroxyarcus emersonii TaxID=2764705 RepID=A0AAN2BZ96_9PROT|nr:bacteriohemerythrin [Sideroxyarcus emersonii]BCK87878.1 bacteriohemerythrin [Sideroxyarcus emersonii]